MILHTPKTKPKLKKSGVHLVAPNGMVQGNYIIPYSVAMVDAIRKREFSGRKYIVNSAETKKLSVSQIREKIAKQKAKSLGGSKSAVRVIAPDSFMGQAHFSPKTMFVLTEAFLGAGVNPKKRSTAFDIASKLRLQVPSLSEAMIQSYANWVYSFTLIEGNREKLSDFKNALQEKHKL